MNRSGSASEAAAAAGKVHGRSNAAAKAGGQSPAKDEKMARSVLSSPSSNSSVAGTASSVADSKFSGRLDWGREGSHVSRFRGTGSKAGAEGPGRKYDFSLHDVHPGIVLGIGAVPAAAWARSDQDGDGDGDGDTRALPAPRPCVHAADGWRPMQAELDTHAADDADAASASPADLLLPHMYGCQGSGLRVLSAAGWMLRAGAGAGAREGEGEGESGGRGACTYVWPLQGPASATAANAEQAQEQEQDQDQEQEQEQEQAQTGARRLARMLGVTLLPAVDSYSIDTAAHCTATLSGHMHSSVRLVLPQDLQRHQRLSSREFLYMCLTDDAQAVAALERARYVFLPGSTLGMGLLAPAGSAGSAETLLAGAAGALSVVFERCSMGNKAVFLSLVGAATSRLMREDLTVAIQYSDFLFLTELECRRLILLFNFDPNRTLEESAVWLADYSKVSGVRPRVVVVLPNPPIAAQGLESKSEAKVEAEVEAEVEAAEEEGWGAGEPLAAHAKQKTRYDSTGQQIFGEFREYDRTHHLNPDELRGRVLLALCGDFFYLPGWPTASSSEGGGRGGGVGGGRGAAMSTYYYNAKLDFRVEVDVGGDDGGGLGSGATRLTAGREGGGPAAAPALAPALTLTPEAHLAYADNFIGGFLAMVVRAEQQVDAQHEALSRHAPAASFVQGTLPNEKVLEMAKDRSVRLQRERERAWPGGLRPPPLQTPRTATPQLNPAERRAGLTGTQKQTMFQTGESRGRNALGTAGVPAGQMSVDAWGDRENDENQIYVESRIKWNSPGPTTGGNLVAGRRLLHECVQAGLHAVYEGNYSARDHRVNRCRFFDLF